MAHPKRDPREKEWASQVRLWEEGRVPKSGWRNAPEAVPAATGSVAISLRIPAGALRLVKELARRKGVGYQVLLKKWIDDRLRGEYDQFLVAQRTIEFGPAQVTRHAAVNTFRAPEK